MLQWTYSVNTNFLSDLLGSIAERGKQFLGFEESNPQRRAEDVVRLCATLVSGRGEASGAAIAQEVIEAYRTLDEAGRIEFFRAIRDTFGPDPDRLRHAVRQWQDKPDEATSSAIHFASEPRRQELLRRLNRAPGGTATVVQMRADLLALRARHPDLALVDQDFGHLLSSWFNRGFLVLRRIDWSTPANILEKIIRYEAVHEIADWNDLRRRIDPADRRCYGFFHPALIDEPLIFVEVALTDDIPSDIESLLATGREIAPPSQARTAVFYSISNCQSGLAGISFGNFLIKQVVDELRRDLPKIETFVTLSPVTGFRKWLGGQIGKLAPDEQALAGQLDEPGWRDDPVASERMRKLIEPLAAYFFLDARNRNSRPLDPVARFHLGNGARLERLNWLGDRSPKAIRESGGLMVNYLYDLDEIIENHEAFANEGVTAAPAAVKRLVRGDLRQRLQNGAGSVTE